jgi:hypothetical protein
MMGDIIYGFAMFFMGLALGWLMAGVPQSHYTRCLSDGGTPAHCAETYLLPTKEVK